MRRAHQVVYAARLGDDGSKKGGQVPSGKGGDLGQEGQALQQHACVARKAGAGMDVKCNGFFRESIYKRVDRRVFGLLMATRALSMALHRRGQMIVECTSWLGRMFVDSWHHNNYINSRPAAPIDHLLGLEKPLINFVWPYT